MSFSIKKVVDQGGLKLMHLNTRSFYRKRHQFFRLFGGFDFITVSESWLHEGYSESLLQWPGKTLYRMDRPRSLGKKTGGGVLCYVSDHLVSNCVLVPELSVVTGDVESLTISYRRLNSKPMLVTTLYRPPDGNLKAFLDYLECVSLSVEAAGHERWFMGDININTLTTDNTYCKRLVDTCRELGLRIIINSCTRPWGRKVSCIDHILTDSDEVIQSGVLAALLSDHLPVFGIKKRTVHEKEVSTVVARNYKNYCQEDLTDLMLEADWDLYWQLESPNEQWDFIHEHIDLFLDYHCPLKAMRIKAGSKDWMTPEILEYISERESLVKLHRKTKDDGLYQVIKKLRNKINHLCGYAKARSVKSLIASCEDDPKKFWRDVNKLFKGSSKVLAPTLVDQESGGTVPATESPDYINDYFANIGSVLNAKFATTPAADLYTEPGPDYEPSVAALHVVEPLVEIMLREVSTSKTSGRPNVRPNVLKHALLCIVPQFTVLLQNSFDTGIFPQAWKDARVTPIPKAGDKSDVGNWRPISLLSMPSKIAERLMHYHLSSAINEDGGLSENQFGYQTGKSTVDAV